MKTYTKTHSSKKVADVHLAKIKKRGGKATVTTVKGGIKIDYYFPEKAAPKKQAAKNTVVKTKAPASKRYDVISPDGFSIRIGVPPFKSAEERQKYFDKWKKRYEAQGYYSSNEGRIPLSELADHCRFITL